jgi:hypothetical protein
MMLIERIHSSYVKIEPVSTEDRTLVRIYSDFVPPKVLSHMPSSSTPNMPTQVKTNDFGGQSYPNLKPVAFKQEPRSVNPPKPKDPPKPPQNSEPRDSKWFTAVPQPKLYNIRDPPLSMPKSPPISAKSTPKKKSRKQRHQIKQKHNNNNNNNNNRSLLPRDNADEIEEKALLVDHLQCIVTSLLTNIEELVGFHLIYP